MISPHNGSIEVRKARSFARRIIEHYLGSKPKRVVARGGGLTNFVFEVNHTKGDFIVRLSTSPEKVKHYLKEQWAIAQANKVGVPTAEVLEVGVEAVGVPHMVLRKVMGQEATHHPERFTVLREMGRLTALIHSISTSGFGHSFDWSSNQLSRNDTWKEYLHGELKVGPRVDLLDKHKMLDTAQIGRLRSIVHEIERWKPTPVLNHGDMRLKNVVVDDRGTITAVIDWEFCTSNVAPYWDLSVALHDLSVDAKQEFLVGYGLRDSKVREMAPIMKAINIINYAPFVERAAEEQDRAKLEQYRTRLAGALDLYSI